MTVSYMIKSDISLLKNRTLSTVTSRCVQNDLMNYIPDTRRRLLVYTNDL